MVRYRDNYRLRNWNDILAAFQAIKIDQVHDGQRLDNTIIEADLKLIQSYASSRYLLSNDSKRLHEQIEQVQYFKEGEHYGFIDYIHDLGELLREGEELPNFRNSFKANIFSNLGWFNQFLITIMLSRMYNVRNIEHKMSAIDSGAIFDCDVELEFGGRTIHCQIKDIAEHDRMDRIHEIKSSIEQGMDYPKGVSYSRRKMAYRIVDFSGSPPQNMSLEKWIEIGATLNIKKRDFTHRIPENTYGTHTAKIIRFQAKGFRRGAFTYSPNDDFSNMEKLVEAYNSIEQRALNTQHTKNESFLLIANSYDHPAWNKTDMQEIRSGILSIMTVHIWGMSMIDFTSIATTKDIIGLEKDFNTRVRASWVKII